MQLDIMPGCHIGSPDFCYKQHAILWMHVDIIFVLEPKLDVTSILLDVMSIQLGVMSIHLYDAVIHLDVMSIQLGVMSIHLYDAVIHLDVTLESWILFCFIHPPILRCALDSKPPFLSVYRCIVALLIR